MNGTNPCVLHPPAVENFPHAAVLPIEALRNDAWALQVHSVPVAFFALVRHVSKRTAEVKVLRAGSATWRAHATAHPGIKVDVERFRRIQSEEKRLGGHINALYSNLAFC